MSILTVFLSDVLRLLLRFGILLSPCISFNSVKLIVLLLLIFSFCFCSWILMFFVLHIACLRVCGFACCFLWLFVKCSFMIYVFHFNLFLCMSQCVCAWCFRECCILKNLLQLQCTCPRFCFVWIYVLLQTCCSMCVFVRFFVLNLWISLCAIYVLFFCSFF